MHSPLPFWVVCTFPSHPNFIGPLFIRICSAIPHSRRSPSKSSMTMTSRQRRARRRSHSSPISRGNKTKDLEPRVYFRQDEVLKPTSTSLDQENYPVYLLEAATVYTPDGERIANLLDVGVKGRVEVRGRLTILPDEAEISHCKLSWPLALAQL